MQTAGVIGLGDMGSGIARNLIANGFQTTVYNRTPAKATSLVALGAEAASNPSEVAAKAQVVFVMVMNGTQAKSVILGQEGLLATMKPGSAVVLTSTILPSEAEELGAAMHGTGVTLIDSPVSGGRPGAQNGTLTLMAAAPDDAMATFAPWLQAISATIHYVGTEPGQGQSVKACLQSLIGSIFSATYEASVLAAKAGVSGTALRNVIATTGAANGITDGSLDHIMNRRFTDTGSHINTMQKDLGIVMDVARDLGVPMHTAGAAMQLFTAGKAAYPDGDNQSVTRVIETIVRAQLKP